MVISIAVAFAFAYGLQMYCTVPAFGDLSDEFGLGLPGIGLFISLFFLGYATAHIPAGFAAAAFGLKAVALAGSVILAGSSITFAVSDQYVVLLLARFIGGVGMSMIVGSVFPLAAAWARVGQVKLVVGGFVNGGGFTGGAAVGLYVWTLLVQYVGWRTSTLIAAGIGLVITAIGAVAIRTPPDMNELDGGHLSWSSTFRCLRSRSMWAIGLGSVGAYGALFTVSQLGPEYAQSELSFTAETAGLMAAAMLLLGIPGALAGGFVADRAKQYLPSLWLPSAVLVLLLALLPVTNSVTIWPVLCGIGIVGTMYFAPCTAAPSEYREEISPQNFGTAIGLVLSLGNLGAIVYPYLYGLVTAAADSRWGWWTLAGVSAVTWFGFMTAREPRTEKNHRPLHKREE